MTSAAISTRADIRDLVVGFYREIVFDVLLAPVFTECIGPALSQSAAHPSSGSDWRIGVRNSSSLHSSGPIVPWPGTRPSDG